MEKKRPLIDPHWQTCPLCQRTLHRSNGRYNHMMYHVRRGEAIKENDPLTDMRFGVHFPYRFRPA